ncbi:dTDP-4-dehydrorhamnose reductase [Gaetbulibacter aestuarii]|uniref:dTDP-4-dehydrorhamnose reductase n=1 Tax=Gaetbulibacter aestuarii TaxID=1502358 RepID=A0ABW7MUT4_9FLAO
MPQHNSNKTKNILVTGANGQLGLCIKALQSKYRDLRFVLTDYEDLDITDLDQVKAFFKMNNFDYCINCAAYTAVDKAETEKELAFKINMTGAKNLAVACKASEVVLIHISTDFVFDGNNTRPYKETDATNPLSVYGKTKLEGETAIQKLLKKYFIIRTSWLYSEYGNNFVKIMLRLAETRNEISVVSDQIGSPTYAGDLAEVILKIIHIQSEDYGIYHYSNKGKTSWFEFAKAIFEEAKKKIEVTPIKTEAYPTAAKRPNYSVLDTSKIKKSLKIEVPFWQSNITKAIK